MARSSRFTGIGGGSTAAMTATSKIGSEGLFLLFKFISGGKILLIREQGKDLIC